LSAIEKTVAGSHTYTVTLTSLILCVSGNGEITTSSLGILTRQQPDNTDCIVFIAVCPGTRMGVASVTLTTTLGLSLCPGTTSTS